MYGHIDMAYNAITFSKSKEMKFDNVMCGRCKHIIYCKPSILGINKGVG